MGRTGSTLRFFRFSSADAVSAGAVSRAAAFGVAVLLSSVLAVASQAAEPARVIQLGLYQKPGVAWWAWKSVERERPELARGLEPLVTPLDPARPDADAALRAAVPAGVDAVALCRRMVGAGLGCLILDGSTSVATSAGTVPAPRPSLDAAPQVDADPSPARDALREAAAATSAPRLSVAPTTPPPAAATRVGGVVVPGQKPGAIISTPVRTPPTLTASLAGFPAPPPAPTKMPSLPEPPQPVVNDAAAPAQGPATLAQAAAAALPGLLRPRSDAAAPPDLMHSAAVPAAALSAILPAFHAEAAAILRAEEARTLTDVDRRARRQGRLGGLVPGQRLSVTPAVLNGNGINYCALTLDDGPHRVVTRRVLEVLEEERVKVTYFPIGKPSEVNGQIIRDFVAAGHEVGNHSYTHGDLRSMSADRQRFEIDETNRILRENGASPVLFRPPYGRYNESLIKVAEQAGMSTVLWNTDTRDWQSRDPDKIVQQVRTTAGMGSVLLLHSTYPSTVSALPRVIAELRSKGCQFVTLSQWIERMRDLAEPALLAGGAEE